MFTCFNCWSNYCYYLHKFGIRQACNRVHTLLSSSNSMNFSMTFSSFPILETVLVLGYFYLTQLNRQHFSVHQNVCHFKKLFNYVFLSLFFVLECAGTNLTNITSIFLDFPWPTIKFHGFQGLENEIIILKFHDFSGFPWPCCKENGLLVLCKYIIQCNAKKSF